MNRASYERLLAEDLEWLAKQPRTLEREHIEQILRYSVDVLYSGTSVAAARNALWDAIAIYDATPDTVDITALEISQVDKAIDALIAAVLQVRTGGRS